MSKQWYYANIKPLPTSPVQIDGSGGVTNGTPIYNELSSQVKVQIEELPQTRQRSQESIPAHGEHSFTQIRNPVSYNNVHDLQVALELANEQLKEKDKQLDDFTAQLAGLHSNDPYRIGDDRIAKQLEGLRHDIRQWSKNFERSSKKSGGVDMIKFIVNGVEEENPFREVTVHYKAYLSGKNPKNTSLLVQGYVWRRLLSDVFSDFIWTGGSCVVRKNESCELYSAILSLDGYFWSSTNKDPIKIKQYHEWRAQTTRIIGNLSRVHQVCIDRKIDAITARMKSDLKGYTEKKGIFNGENSTTLFSIIKTAVDIDMTFWKQKADFKFRRPSDLANAVRFQAGWMKTDDAEVKEEDLVKNGTLVKLICAPALIRYGTSEGENYHEDSLICPEVVDCLVTQTIN